MGKEPACVHNHDQMRRDLARRGIFQMPCPACGWMLSADRKVVEEKEQEEKEQEKQDKITRLLIDARYYLTESVLDEAIRKLIETVELITGNE